MNEIKANDFIEPFWNEKIIPTLMKYIKIPNKSPQFDHDWRSNGHMEKAVSLLSDWCKDNAVKNMSLDILRLEERTPLIFIDIPGNSEETILLYGHLDKQPEMTGWSNGLAPFTPVLRGDKLYGRGAADDGYAIFAALTAIKFLQKHNKPHARCIIIIEASEESGSNDLPAYVDHLKERIGEPNLIICLDSGCNNYDQLWLTTSLRGLVGGNLTIEVLNQGVHSGTGSGIVPSCFRILRQLLNRIEDEKSGNILIDELSVDIPKERIKQAELAAHIVGDSIFKDLPFVKAVEPESFSVQDLILRQTWKPALSVVGLNGMPIIENAGNVTLPFLSVKLSMRLPPTCDPKKASIALKNILEKNSPHQAKVHFEIHEANAGWNAPNEEVWLSHSIDQASKQYFGKKAAYLGEGGTIPFMGMLGKKFPNAQFVITGVLGPESNAHGPNEFLHIPTAKKITSCIAQVIADHYQQASLHTLESGSNFKDSRSKIG